MLPLLQPIRTCQTCIVEMREFSFRFFSHELLSHQKGFCSGFFPLDSCRAGMNVNQTFTFAPGAVMHYDYV